MSLPRIKVENLSIGYDGFAVMNNLNFEVGEGEVFVVMGASGCGKSTLLRTMIGLQDPICGSIYYSGKNFNMAPSGEKLEMLRSFGVLYQGGALWSAMTLAENIALPMRQFTKLSEGDIKE
ncbi:MAG: ATP-binding cassette domain-containing protein, partial [Opitutales bacterium]|nr:ATP-binding cassette domain-containing protein [Opitutales bacterium]